MSRMASFGDFFGRLLRKNITEYPPLQVVDVKPEEYVHCEIHLREESLILYHTPETSLYEIVLHKELQNNAFSICRCRTLSDSTFYFHSLTNKLPTLLSVSPNNITTDALQDMFNYTKEHPNQSVAHLSAHFAFLEYFRLPQITDTINSICPDTGMTPLHVAVKTGKLLTVQTLLNLGVKIDVIDKEGNNVLHYAASTTKEIINAIVSQQSIASNLIRLINSNNNDNFKPLHIACLHDKPECVKELLKNGADMNGASINEYSYPDSSHEFSKSVIDQLDPKDMKNGGTPLHWARSSGVMEALIEKGCNINARNFQGETVLHVMVSKSRLSCVITLLCNNADFNSTGPNGNTPLHIAVKSADVSIVQALIVFGANINMTNSSGETPRHIAATAKRTPQQDMILYVLHSVGAKRCSTIRLNCNDGCSQSDASHFNGIPPDNSPFNRSDKLYDILLGEEIVKKAISMKKASIFESTQKMDIDDGNSDKIRKSCRLLCLDGGGIKGLILIQMLWVLEELMQKKIIDCFDWIGGTSTGAILALTLAMGHSISECRQLYFKLKDKVFVGNRPYESELLDNFLRKLLGEDSKMSDIKKPRIMVTATIADRFPPDMQLFRNYESPSNILGIPSSDPNINEQLVWKAARSSGAAPTYFRPCSAFIDGGLVSNNPTLDAITEIHSINKALDATGRESEKVKLDVVVSLGTGSIPVKDVPIIDFGRESIYEYAKTILLQTPSLVQLLVEQATQSNGQTVERAKAWCSMINVPYFRLNPPLSEDIPLDETKDVKLVNVLWETMAFMNSRRNEIDEIILLLN